jgi:uncharacterized protein (TIGR00369 family)
MNFDPEIFFRQIPRQGHNGALGAEYRGHGDDWIELALPYDAKLVGNTDTGILASGPIISLMDMAAGMSTWLRAGTFRPSATLDLRVDYLRPAKPGNTVVGRAQCYRMTRNIAFVRGQAHDGDPGDLVAHVVGTFMFTEAPA